MTKAMYIPHVNDPHISGYSYFVRIGQKIREFVNDSEAFEFLRGCEKSYEKYGLTPEDDYLLER